VILCMISMLLIRWRLRAKHRRRLAQINAAADGGINRFPASHMCITDEDVARMPGTRAAACRSLQDRNRRSLYTPMSSRETLESRPVLKSLERVKEINRNDRENTVPMWPLPRRCIRSDGSPLSKKTSTTPRDKKGSAWNFTPKRATDTAPKPSQQSDTRPCSLDNIQNKVEKKPSPTTDRRLPDRVDNGSSPNGDLKPAPLFHDKRRSKSHGNVSQMAGGKRIAAGLYVTDPQDHGTQSVPRGTQSVPRRTHVPRSMSMCSQDPGAAPTHLLPPLPFEIESDQNRRTKSPADFSGCGSLFSDNTSILNDEESNILSHAETGLTSIGLSSPFFSSTLSESTPRDLSLWGTSELREKASRMSVSESLKLRPQLSTQRSYRASIEDSLSGSISSSLSMSLIDPALRTASSSDLAKRKSRANSDSNMETPRRGEKKKAKRPTSPSSPLRKLTEFEIHEDESNERLSMCILRPISGNEGHPYSSGQHPSPTATDSQFLWDPYTSKPPGKTGDTISGHHRQNCVRIPDMPISAESPTPSRIEELKDVPPNTAIKHIVAHKPNMAFRPPSRATFDVHYTPLGRIQNAHLPKVAPPYSPTLSMAEMYDEKSDGPESAMSTPTRKPSHKIPSGSHPNRAKSIFNNQPKNPWPLPEPASECTDPQTSNIFPQSSQHHCDPPTETDSRPRSSLFNFPNPPKRPFPPNWRAPKTPIRGPRAIPRAASNLKNSPSRRSPSRSPSKGIAKAYSTNGPRLDLRTSIMQLRRQNSEVNVHQSNGSREHKRYLSIGDDIFEDEGKENEWGGMRGSKTMPFLNEARGASMPDRRSGGLGVGTPSSFYDGEDYFGEA